MKLATLITTIVTACAACLALAGIAPAGTHPNDRAGMQGVGAAAAITSGAVRPDDRAGLLGAGGAEAITPASGRPDGRLTPDGADIGDSSPSIVLVETSGFDWLDAGIGAAGAAGAFLLALSLALGATWMRRGRRHAAV
jgi:hypothetical protein